MNTSKTHTVTQYLQRPEGRIAYDVRGTGPLVVCVAGMGDLRSTYREVGATLEAEGFRVATADLRGHGDSDRTFTRHGDLETAGDLLALIEELGGPALVIGNSMAGSSAVVAAAQTPEAIAGMFLISPFLRNLQTDGQARFGRLLYRVLFAPMWGRAAWVSYFRSTLNRGRQAPWLGEQAAAIDAWLRMPGALRSLRELMLQLDHSVVEPFSPAAASTPSVVVVGAVDPDYQDPAAELDHMADALGGRPVLVEEAAHYAHAQRPDVVLPELVAFADSLRDGMQWRARA